MASSTTQVHPSAPPPPKGRRIDLTSTKVIGSAGAAVTSAIGSSLFGATGTIAGAAVGSVISTVAGAVYERSLQNAGHKLRETTVVVRSVPGRSARPTALPRDLPEVEAGAERQDAEPTQAIEPADVTTAMPTIGLPVAEQGEPVTLVTGPPEPPEPEDKPVFAGFGRKKLAVLGVTILAGFGIALGGMTILESALGRQLNGDRGTSIGQVTGTSTGTSNDEDTRPAEQEPTATPTEETTGSPEATESADPDATAEPTDSATGEPSESAEPTGEPTAEPTQDGGAGTDTSQGSGAGSGDSGGSGAGAAPAPTAAAND